MPLLQDTLHWLGAIALAALLAARGYRRRSLSASGAAAALLVGTLVMGADYVFGAQLIAFYVIGTAATRWRGSVKAAFDLEHRAGGQRDWAQVLATAGCAAFIACYKILLAGSSSILLQTSLQNKELGAQALFAVTASLATPCGEEARAGADPANTGTGVRLGVAAPARMHMVMN